MGNKEAKDRPSHTKLTPEGSIFFLFLSIYQRFVFWFIELDQLKAQTNFSEKGKNYMLLKCLLIYFVLLSRNPGLACCKKSDVLTFSSYQ